MAKQDDPKRELILVVDDSAEIRHFLVEYVLAPQGYNIITGSDGLEGVELAIKYKPDLMIVDVQMPYMSGLELLRRLRERRVRIPAILATAHGSEQVAVEAFRLGVRNYVIKPFDLDEIKMVVEQALRETRLEAERNRLMLQLKESNRRLRQRAQELNALYGIGKSVSSSLHLEKVLERVVEAAVFLADAREGAIMLIDEQRGDLYVHASKNMNLGAREMRLSMDGSIAGRVLRNQHTAVLNEWDLPEMPPAEGQARMPYSYAYIPMVARGRAVGLLAVAIRASNEATETREARVLSALASYAATAITNAKLYDHSLSERNQLRTIINQINDPVLVVDDNNCIILVNETSRAALQLPDGPLTGQPLAGLITQQEVLEFITQPAGPAISRHVEIALNNNRLYEASLTTIEGVGRSVILHDITQLNQLNQVKTDIVSAVSHDLRSPLTAILGYVELLERAGPLNDVQHTFVARVHESVHKITTLIGELLDVSRLEEGPGFVLAPCHLDQVLQSVVETFRLPLENKQQRLSYEVDPDLVVLGDANRLYQAFSNLLANAHKYTPEQGQIRLRGRRYTDQAIIEVADNGIGISSEEQTQIFEKYYRGAHAARDYHGTGLGLYIVKSIVEQHDGRIWVHSQVGRGTTIFTMLPLRMVEKEAAAGEDPTAAAYSSD